MVVSFIHWLAQTELSQVTANVLRITRAVQSVRIIAVALALSSLGMVGSTVIGS